MPRILRLPGHTDEVTQLSAVPGTSLLVSGSGDGSALVWDCTGLGDAAAALPAPAACLATPKGSSVDALAVTHACCGNVSPSEGAATRLHVFLGCGEAVAGYDVNLHASPSDGTGSGPSTSATAPRIAAACSWRYNRDTVASLSVTASTCAGSSEGLHACALEVVAGDDDGDIAVVTGAAKAATASGGSGSTSNSSGGAKGGKKSSGGKKKKGGKPAPAAAAAEETVEAEELAAGAPEDATTVEKPLNPSVLADREWAFTRSLRRGHASLCGGVLSVEVPVIGSSLPRSARLLISGGFDQRLKVWAGLPLSPTSTAPEIKWRGLAIADPTKIETAAAGEGAGGGGGGKGGGKAAGSRSKAAPSATPTFGTSPFLLELSPALRSNGYTSSTLPAPPTAEVDYGSVLDPVGLAPSDGGKVGNPPFYHALASAAGVGEGWQLRDGGGAVFAAAIGDGSIAVYAVRAASVDEASEGASSEGLVAAAAGVVRLGVLRDAHAGPATCVAFVPFHSRRLLVSGGNDGRVKLWEVCAPDAAVGVPFASDCLSFVPLFSSHHSKRGPNSLAALPLRGGTSFAIAVGDSRKEVVLYVWDELPPLPSSA